MFRHFTLALAMLLASSPLFAQTTDPTAGRCARPDSIAIRGNSRVADATIRAEAGLAPGTDLNYRVLQRAIRNLYATTQFDSITVTCDPAPPPAPAILTIGVSERPMLASYTLSGTDRVSAGSVRERIELTPGRPLDPAQVATSVQRIDSLYESSGFYLARVRVDTVRSGDQVQLSFRIEEGRRLAVSGVRVRGNTAMSDEDIVGAMETKPEGFLWFRRGGFDEDEYAGDLGERIPALYARQGYIDFAIVRDTLIIDRERGKALIEIEVSEGARYRVGDFESVGNRRFSSEEIERFYPFTGDGPTITSRVTDFIRRRERAPRDVFDQSRWEEATNNLSTAYRNEGYIYAGLRPVVERRVTADSQAVVDLRWEIDEKSPAIVNRIEIAGNDYTIESCIRDQLLILPGDVFNQDRLIRSYQNIGNLGFFETPLPPPDTRTANEQGDVDVVFSVKERRTGNVNFGASMGQGYGVGGFIGLDQPNLFGQCKRGSLQWQFGRYINDFNLTYSDPRIRQSRVQGTISAYRSQTRYNLVGLGRSLRTGGSLQFGFPVPNSPFSRFTVSYGGETVAFGTGGLLGETRSEFGNGQFRSTLGLGLNRDTRIDLPFPTAGSMQALNAQFNGGPLGGSQAFSRYTGEVRTFAPLGQIGGTRLGSQPMKFVLGLSARAGAVFGDTGPFFYSQEFSLGGVQFGEMLRGYDEFSISPNGYVTGTSQFSAQRGSFGKAFFASTAEVGLRFNQALYLNVFYDAGNVWARARDFDPTRLFRGAGIGVSTVTPLGPLGLDYAYGFDRLDVNGRPAPKWQLHFRLGQLF